MSTWKRASKIVLINIMALSSRLPKHEYINARFDGRKTQYPPLHNMCQERRKFKGFWTLSGESCTKCLVLYLQTCKHIMKEGNDEVHSLNKIFSCVYSFEKGNTGFHEKNPWLLIVTSGGWGLLNSAHFCNFILTLGRQG